MSLKGELLRLLNEHRVLNGRQACRLVNGRGKDEYEYCYFSFREKPKGLTGIACRNQIQKKCKYSASQVLSCLNRMKWPVQSLKIRFHDHGGIGKDIFRFFFMDWNDFEELILRQTLIPYIQGEKHKLLEASQK